MRLRFDDVQEAVETLPGLELDYKQVDRGPQDILFDMHSGHDVTFTQIQLLRGVEGCGDARPGRVCCVLALAGSAPHLYDGQAVAPGQIYVRTGSNDGAHQLLHPGYNAWVLDLPRDRLRVYLNQEPEIAWGARSVFDLKASDRSQLLAVLDMAGHSTGAGPLAERRTTDRLLSCLCQALPLRPVGDLPGSETGRYALARAVREQMNQFPDWTVADLCLQLSLSESTLRRVFQEFFGVSPAQYSQVVRLNRVRAELRRSPFTKGTVSRVATRHGFWHMGRFGAQYRRLFGESPVETLVRGSGCGGSGELRLGNLSAESSS